MATKSRLGCHQPQCLFGLMVRLIDLLVYEFRVAEPYEPLKHFIPCAAAFILKLLFHILRPLPEAGVMRVVIHDEVRLLGADAIGQKVVLAIVPLRDIDGHQLLFTSRHDCHRCIAEEGLPCDKVLHEVSDGVDLIHHHFERELVEHVHEVFGPIQDSDGERRLIVGSTFNAAVDLESAKSVRERFQASLPTTARHRDQVVTSTLGSRQRHW